MPWGLISTWAKLGTTALSAQPSIKITEWAELFRPYLVKSR